MELNEALVGVTGGHYAGKVTMRKICKQYYGDLLSMHMLETIVANVIFFNVLENIMMR